MIVTTGHVQPSSATFHPDPQIDVIMLYSKDALDSLDVTATQMETTIIETLVWSNTALSNSLISATFRLVHVGPVRGLKMIS